MEITIIGWYGTETIGDRAILAGIFRLLSDAYGSFSVRIGSLYPFYTERTLLEDIAFYRKSSRNDNLKIAIFDSRNPFCLKSNIRKSNLLLLGGGPLMDLQEMSLLDAAFEYAKRKNVKTAILGCGWGPLSDKGRIEIAKRLVDSSSIAILRDKISLEQAKKNGCSEDKIISAIDPAFIACSVYLKEILEESRSEDFIAVNFRDIGFEGKHYSDREFPSDIFVNILKVIQAQSSLPVRLIPMHNFFIGGDDRIFLNKICQCAESDRISVMQHPLSLQETMSQYYNAACCVGMRFHSIVLQTMLNGKNIIVDYTDPKVGKIIGMIKEMGIEEKCQNRYMSLHNLTFIPDFSINTIERIKIEDVRIDKYRTLYVEKLKMLLI